MSAELGEVAYYPDFPTSVIHGLSSEHEQANRPRLLLYLKNDLAVAMAASNFCFGRLSKPLYGRTQRLAQVAVYPPLREHELQRPLHDQDRCS